MKAKTAIGNINFERGMDPKNAMEIGRPEIRAAKQMISGVLYKSNTPKWYYSWWYKDPRDNKIYYTFEIRRGNIQAHVAKLNKSFPLDLEPTKRHFDKFIAKVNKIEESQNFERGIDAKDSIRIGRKHIWNMTAEELANYILDVVTDNVRPKLNKIEAAVKKAGYKDIETYQEYVYLRFDKDDEFPFVSKEIDDAEQELEEAIAAEVEQFPTKDEKAKKDLIGDLFTLELEGGPHKTYVEMVKQKLDPAYLKESVNFERGVEPKKSMEVGMTKVLSQIIEELLKFDEKFQDILREIRFYRDGVEFACSVDRSKLSDKQRADYIRELIEKFGLDSFIVLRPVKLYRPMGMANFIFELTKEGHKVNPKKRFYLHMNGGVFTTEDNKISSFVEDYLYAKTLQEAYNFERGINPKNTMNIGAYRTDAPKRNLFKRMHQLAKACPIFKFVTEIRWEGVEPSFKISSNKTHKKTPSIFKENFTIYLTKEEELGILLFDDIEDTEYENITLKEFLKITSCKLIKESQNFERNQDVKKSMDVGIRHKYGKFYDLFEICHNLSTNSENFTYVSDIIFDKGEQPFFNIESVFFYTDDDNNKIPEGFVITLWPEEILCLNTITKDEDTIKTEAKFIKITTCWDEDDNGGWMYES